MQNKRTFILTSMILIASLNLSWSKTLKVSQNRRFLQYDDDTPFFYLGDTAWELFHRLNREEADTYLANRAGKSFTVIQAVAHAQINSPS